ncbi:MAG: hypothetical protein KDM91_12270, partial [Verrucomicrobiae bacterium]|nr:hypothetical protein [Verrucomicrobiae bacterium]
PCLMLDVSREKIHRQMNELERAIRQLGEAFGEKWNEMNPGTNGTGFMFWDDRDHCIYADFFGLDERADKARIASTLITTNEELRIPYSLRVGFHESEKVARRTMME